MEAGTTDKWPLPRKLPGTEGRDKHTLAPPEASLSPARDFQWLTSAGSQPPGRQMERGRDREKIWRPGGPG